MFGLSLVACLIVNVAAFYLGLYRHFILDPTSSTGSFERAVEKLQAWPADRTRDILVFGDSRIYAGLQPAIADASGSGLRFLNAGLPGTNPRCWYFFSRAIDPSATRFRAVVIPVDSYSDDTSSIGSLDADDHAQDLRAIVFATDPRDVWRVASSFDEPSLQRDVAFDLFLRGPILRDDFQAFLADPAGRFSARSHVDPSEYDPRAAHPFEKTLTGLRVDFARNHITTPPGVDETERGELEKQIFPVPHSSASYAAYRSDWLGPIVRRYVAAGVPIVFVRIPARPVHRAYPAGLAGSLVALQRDAGSSVHTIAQAPYLALERPDFFADHDHLDLAGSRIFSRLLGRDVARALRGASPGEIVDASQPPVRPARLTAAELAGAAAVVFGIAQPLRFASIDYALFLGLVIVLLYKLPERYRPAMLLAASYFFYLRWNAWYVVFLLFLTASDFLIALRLGNPAATRKKTLLAIGIAFNLAFLASFKYTNFATSTFFALLGSGNDPWIVALVVPVGISFHTFQSISYLVDVARGRIPATRKPLAYALYIAFFPQLLAGPIVRAGLFFDELRHWRPPAPELVERGVREIALGLVKKLAIADQFAPVADAYFAAPASQPNAGAAWSAVLAFAIQIYFDFSGYSDIAIGSARLLGFNFPANFRRPYLAGSITDFWRRWHISLSAWLRDYLYIPLGGNRSGRFGTYRNLVLTMLLGGLWHGASWTFVAWGGYHGALLAAERALRLGDATSLRRPLRAARIALTFALVLFGWVLFRAQSFGDAFVTYRALFTGAPGPAAMPAWPLVLVAIALAMEVLAEAGADAKWRSPKLATSVLALSALLLVSELASLAGKREPFLYFKF